MYIFKNIPSLKLLLNLLLPSLISVHLLACSEPVSGSAFDWDDNIMFMPTKVLLFHKGSDEVINISTSDYAKYNPEIGKSGKYQDYEIRVTQKENSYKYFRDPIDRRTESYFIADVKKAVQQGDQNWHGPSWDKFVAALNDEAAAEWTSIITARGHSPQTIYQGLEYLKAQGLIKYLPKIENIYPVSHPTLRKMAASPSEIKTKVIINMLDRISSCQEKANQSSNDKPLKHVWGFSDDDYENYSRAQKMLSTELANGRWNNVKVSLFYTGHLMSIQHKLRYPYNDNFTAPFGLMEHLTNYL